MRLTGNEILTELNRGKISITPFDKKNLGANSYDVRLAPTLHRVTSEILDFNQKIEYEAITIPAEGYTLLPNEFYLGVTLEHTSTELYLPILDGRSTVARYGLSIHQTAGFGDIGFSGHWTLEITVVKPTVVYPGMRIAQISFDRVQGEIHKKYTGNYANQYSESPIPRNPKPNNW